MSDPFPPEKPVQATERAPSILLRTTNVLGYLLLILVNVLANYGVFGPSNSEVSKTYPTPLTPAGWAFSIWGLIFLLQGCGVVHQAFFSAPEDSFKRSIINTIGYGWQAGWYMECMWQIFFVKQTYTGMWLCLVSLCGALAAFGATLWRLYSLLEERKQNINALFYLLYLLPTSINTAWLSVATALGVLIVPVAHDVPPRRLEPAALICAAIIACVGALVILRKRDAGYGLTLTWAFVAVFGAHRSPLIKYSSLSCTLVLLLLSMFVLSKRRQRLHDLDEEESDDEHEQLLTAGSETAPSSAFPVVLRPT